MATKKKTSGKSSKTQKTKTSTARAGGVPRIGKDVLSRKNSDGSVAVMRLDNDECFFTIDGIAAEAWSSIDGRASIDQIKAKLVRKHQPPLARFERDIAKLFQQLKKEKLISL